MKERRNGAKGLPWFWIAMLLLVMVNSCVIGVLLSRLHRELIEYEAATPGAALRAYVAAIEEGDFGLILEDSGFSPSPLNLEEDYRAMVEERFGGLSSPQFRKTSSPAAEGWEQYMLYDGEEEAGTVWITPAPAESGRHWRVRCDYDYREGYTVTVPQHLEVYANGRQLTPYNAAIEMVAIPAFGSLPEEERPVRMRYKTEPTLYEQEITVHLPEGDCVLGPDEGGDPRRLEGWENLSEETRTGYAALIEEAAKAYAAFVTNDAAFSEFSGYLLPGTQFYNSVRTFDRQWYVPHDGYGFDQIEVSDITAWSEDSFSGDIRFDYKVYSGRRTYTYPTAYHMPFVRVDGQWKLVHIQVR